MLKLIKSLSLILTIIGSSFWAVLAIYFGDSNSNTTQLFIATAFGIFGLVTLISLKFVQSRKPILASYFLLFTAILIWWFTAITPSNQRQWQPDVAQLAFATRNENLITINNIRNFDYHSEFDYSPSYYSKTYDLNKLEGISLFAIYWMGPAIAHTILSFNFGDNNHLAISIEARKEQGEGYSTIKGFFRQYELIYIVADERDVIRLRTNYRKDPVENAYLYPLQLSPEIARQIFLEYINKINDLHEKPSFYNTLINNCTTEVWYNTRITANHLPFSWKILVSGYVPEYLYESNILDTKTPFEYLQQQVHINTKAHAADQATDFSRLIRVGIESFQ